MERFELDEPIIAFLDNTLTPDQSRTIQIMFNTLADMRDLEISEKICINTDIDTLEQEILDEIYENQDDNNAVRDTIVSLMLKYITESTADIGIVFEPEDQNIFKIAKLVDAYYNILTCDPNTAIRYVEILTDDLDNEIIDLSNMLAEHCDLYLDDIVNMLQDVGEDLISELVDYLEQRSTIQLEVVTDNEEYIKKLVNLDVKFAATEMVDNIINNLVNVRSFEANINSLYRALERYEFMSGTVPYEIVATLYFSSDSHNNMEEVYRDRIDISTLEWLKDDQSAIDKLHNDTIALIMKVNEIIKGVTNEPL